MTDGIYRDPLAGLRARVEELRTRAHELDARLGWAVWAAIGHHRRDRVAALRAESAVTGASDAEGLVQTEQRLERLVSEYIDVEASIPALEEELLEDLAEPFEVRPNYAGIEIIGASSIDEVGLLLLMPPVLDELRAMGVTPIVKHAEDAVTRVLFNLDGVEYVLAAFIHYRSALPAAIRYALGARVSRIVPDFTIERAGVLTGVATALGLVLDLEIGDPRIDKVYRIGAPPEIADLIGHATRRALRVLVDHAPSLQVAGGIARVAWTAGPPAGDLAAPIGALAELRSASLELRRRP